MHWLIPFASGLSPRVAQLLPTLVLPNLARLLRRLTLAACDTAEATSLSPPHERAFAAAVGWRADDGCLPFAAHAATHDGIDTSRSAWGLVTPSHWQVGRDRVVMTDPALLQLDAVESRLAFDAVRPLFEDAGLALAWGAPERWYARADALERLPTASLDRVIGRDVESWLRPVVAVAAEADAFARRLRRLQSECQMLLYPHPLNEERESRGAPTLNSFWLSGCGRAQPLASAPPCIDAGLRAACLADDGEAWAAAWQALDNGPLAEAATAVAEGAPVVLTLCGERNAHRFEALPRTAWQRISAGLGRGRVATPHQVLEAL